MPANDWCNEGMKVASGKGGGKKDRVLGAAKAHGANKV